MTDKTIDRRKFIKGIGALGAVGAASITTSAFAGDTKTPAILTGKREWRMAMTWPKTLPGLGTGAVRLAERITNLSEGKLNIKVYGAGELVPALGVFDACADGSLEMAHASSYYWLSKNRSFAFFAAVPGGMTAQEIKAWQYFGDGQKLAHELYAQFGLVSFPAGNTGTQMGGWFKKPLHSLEDLKGLKMRIPGIAGEIFSKLGGNPQNIPGGELYTSLQSGVIDALEWVGPWNDMALGFHRIADYYYGPGFQEGGPTLELILNKQAYDDLPVDLKRVVKLACACENQLMESEYFYNNLRAYEDLKKVESLTIAGYPADIKKSMFSMAQDVLADTATLGNINKRIYDSYASFRSSAMDMAKVTEYGFMQGRYSALEG